MYLLDLRNVSLFWLVCESLPSHSIYKKWRDVQTFLSSINITHPSKLQNELVLILTHFLAFVSVPNRAAMKRTPNHCQMFPPHESFSSLRKPDFPNIWNGGWLSSVSDWSSLLFSLTQAISSARRLHVYLLFCPCSIGHLIQSVLAKYDKIILKDDLKNIQEQVLSKRSTIKRTTKHDWSGFCRCLRRVTLISGWGKRLSTVTKLVSRPARSQSCLCPFNLWTQE